MQALLLHRLLPTVGRDGEGACLDPLRTWAGQKFNFHRRTSNPWVPISPLSSSSDSDSRANGSFQKQDLGTLAATGVGEAFVLRYRENADVGVAGTPQHYDLVAHVSNVTRAAALLFVFVLSGSAALSIQVHAGSTEHPSSYVVRVPSHRTDDPQPNSLPL
eukprot:m.686738 g.686738  ORF g.686738 m.686738 type:complete len:161 (+) comp22840_c0_seq41:186-668(+)